MKNFCLKKEKFVLKKELNDGFFYLPKIFYSKFKFWLVRTKIKNKLLISISYGSFSPVISFRIFLISFEFFSKIKINYHLFILNLHFFLEKSSSLDFADSKMFWSTISNKPLIKTLKILTLSKKLKSWFHFFFWLKNSHFQI